MDVALRLGVGLVLLAAAAAKLRAPRDLPDVLRGYAIPGKLAGPAAVALVAVEAVVGALLVAGVVPRVSTGAAVALGLVFAGAVARVRLRGITRLRCGCFGAAERSTAFLLVRALAYTALAALAAAAAAFGVPTVSTDAYLVSAVALLGTAVLALGALVLGLYRQVGVLTLRVGPAVGALELAEEGPEIGAPAPALPGLAGRGSELVAFLSPSCRLCRELLPGVRALARDGLAVRLVDEAAEEEAFAAWNVPGSPFAVHVMDGVVAAKGLVNTLEQLDGLVEVGRARSVGAAA